MKFWRTLVRRSPNMARSRHNYVQIVSKVAQKFYETAGTGSLCCGDHLEKSTVIQVNLANKSRRFQCSHRPPRARRYLRNLRFRESRSRGVYSLSVAGRSEGYWRQGAEPTGGNQTGTKKGTGSPSSQSPRNLLCLCNTYNLVTNITVNYSGLAVCLGFINGGLLPGSCYTRILRQRFCENLNDRTQKIDRFFRPLF